MSYWPLLGVALVVLGFVFRLNPLLVVVAAGVATGLLAGIGPRELLALIGSGFLKSRFLLLLVLTLPVIGLCERSGLRARAAVLIGRLRGATAGRLLIAYLALRQFAAMLGLTAIAGHPQTVRPLLAPMVEAAAANDHGIEPERKRETLRAYSAATDNVGLFFGEDVFLAFGAVLLIQGFLAQSGYALDPIQIALWGLPTAIAAFVIHAWRLTRLDARLRRPPEGPRPGRAGCRRALAVLMALLYVFIGLVIAATAVRVYARGGARRAGAAVFWGLIALVFLAGDWLPEELVGVIVLALAVLAGIGAVGRATHDLSEAAEPVAAIGDRVFWPVLAIPLITVAAVLTGKVLTQPPNALLDAQQLALLSLAMACAIALAFALHLTRAKPQLAFAAGADLLDAIGWAAVLPLTLAMLGTVFAQAHVGDAVAALVAQAVPIDSRFACVLAFAFAMLALTAVMGNAFAAFPVVMGGIGLPLLIARHGANPATLGAIGMLTGYCGTLLTPMAANFNIVPVALLELRDDWAVIKAQAPTGLALFGVNVVLLQVLAF